MESATTYLPRFARFDKGGMTWALFLVAGSGARKSGISL